MKTKHKKILHMMPMMMMILVAACGESDDDAGKLLMMIIMMLMTVTSLIKILTKFLYKHRYQKSKIFKLMYHITHKMKFNKTWLESTFRHQVLTSKTPFLFAKDPASSVQKVI